MTLLPAILALLVAAAGWYYAFYSSAAGKLSGIERPSANRLRVRLRRINGCLMIVLGALFFILASALEQKWRPLTIGWLTLSVLVLLLPIAALVMIDLSLTRRMREKLRAAARQRDDNQDSPS
jgi:hypothetical protein